ncbi:hypothetical protein JCM11251_005798 [Rhodosporidiobolus azoricus]
MKPILLIALLAFSAPLFLASPLPQSGLGTGGLDLTGLTGDEQLSGGLSAILGSGSGARRAGNETEREGGRLAEIGKEEEEATELKRYLVGEDGCVAYGADGRDAAGYDALGLDRDGRDLEGYGLDGFNAQNRTRRGNDRQGRDAAGKYGIFNVNGRDIQGFDIGGFGPDGFSREGRNRQGLDKDGYNLRGLNAGGADRQGRRCVTISSDPIPPADASSSSPNPGTIGSDDDQLDFPNFGQGTGDFEGLEDAF